MTTQNLRMWAYLEIVFADIIKVRIKVRLYFEIQVGLKSLEMFL